MKREHLIEILDNHRALIELGLVQLKHFNRFPEYNYASNALFKSIESLCDTNIAVLDELEKEPCKWQETEEGDWVAGCNNLFCINDGTPEENNMKYCCYCGGKIEQTVFEEEEE